MSKKNRKTKGKKLLSLLILLLVLVTISVVLKVTEPSNTNAGMSQTIISKDIIRDMELPYFTNDEVIRYRNGYTLNYNPKHRQPNWVAYVLTSESIYGNVEREDNFHEDESVPNPSTLQDYRRSGYDRGHIKPAADSNYSNEAMDDSFYMSNMSPQVPDFNRGIWSTLESTVRNFADTEGVIYVATGPVFDNTKRYKTIGKNKVTVPHYYYKAILKLGDKPKAIGFILPNSKGNNNLKSYAITIDEVEDFTGIDFFANLDDEIENKVEASLNTSLWDFNEFYKNGTTKIVKTSKSKNSSDNGSILYKIRRVNDKLINIVSKQLEKII